MTMANNTGVKDFYFTELSDLPAVHISLFVLPVGSKKLINITYDIPPIMAFFFFFCSFTYLPEFVLLLAAGILGGGAFLVTLISYINIISAILWMHFAEMVSPSVYPSFHQNIWRKNKACLLIVPLKRQQTAQQCLYYSLPGQQAQGNEKCIPLHEYTWGRGDPSNERCSITSTLRLFIEKVVFKRKGEIQRILHCF
ncbi:Olfactory receptor 8J1, partial [Ophiophagus hannah]